MVVTIPGLRVAEENLRAFGRESLCNHPSAPDPDCVYAAWARILGHNFQQMGPLVEHDRLQFAPPGCAEKCGGCGRPGTQCKLRVCLF